MTCRTECREQAAHRAAWLVLGTLIFALSTHWLARRGMTWDGVLYATIARNMAAGICDAWHPLVSGTFMRHFHEHPPLAFWLESVFFHVFGDHFWVERLYSISTGLMTGAVLVAIWRTLVGADSRAAACSWLAIGMWLCCGYWSYLNNILENTLGMFTALSVYASLRALQSERRWAGWAAASGVAIAAALLSKGPVGLFPAVTPAIAWVTLRRASGATAVRVQLGLLCCAAGSFGLMLIPAVAREYLGIYWHQQILASVTGQREAITSFPGQLGILLYLPRYLFVPVLLTGMALLLSRRTGWAQAPQPTLTGPRWFCLLTALSASLPLVACPKQNGHYTAPSWPFYVLALALWCLPVLLALLPRLDALAAARGYWLVRGGALAAIACSLGLAGWRYGAVGRDRPIIHASNQIARAVGAGATIVVLPDAWNGLKSHEQLRLHAYLYRDHCISLWTEEPHPEKIGGHLRLQRPKALMQASYEQIVTDSGFECYPLLAHRDELPDIRPPVRR